MINKKQDDPPLEWIHPERAMAIWIVSVVLILIASVLFICFARFPEEEIDNINFQYEKVQDGDPLHITKEGLIANAPHCLIKGEPRGNLIFDIIHCESEGDPKICNKEFGCRAGMGLCGFISGTWNTTLDKMKKVGAYMPERCWEKVSLPVSVERTEMIFDAECNLLAGKWLLENEGSQHWGTSETEWGSYWCWAR